MFKRPACLQGRQRNGAGEDWSAFPIRQLFILGKFGTFARYHELELELELCNCSKSSKSSKTAGWNEN
jgi:hypothetical protein